MEAVQDAAAASEEDTIFSGESGANPRISIKDFPLPLFLPSGFLGVVFSRYKESDIILG